MITYVDTSVLVKLLVEEPGSDDAERIWSSGTNVASVTLVEVEARAALAAARRARRLKPAQHRAAVVSLGELVGQLDAIEVTEDLIERASALAEAESLRAYDAVHLAGALVVDASVMASADVALCSAAANQGLHVAGPMRH